MPSFNANNLLKNLRNAVYGYFRTNGLDKKAISVLGMAEVSGVSLAIVNSAGTVMISGDQFTTIGAATTALTGALSVEDTTTPSVTLQNGKTNTGFLLIKGKTSGSLKIITADSTAQAITISAAAQTSGASTWTIPDAAGVNQTFMTLALAQTVTGQKTFVAPVLGVATGTSLALTAGLTEGVTTISGDGAVTLASGTVVLTKGSAAAITVAAPSSQDGTKIRIISNSDFAHVVTFTGSTLLDGTTGANLTVTMTAFKGSAIEVVAVGTKWLLVSSSNVTSITA